MNRSSQRKAYGATLVELGHLNPNVVVLEADLGKSTMSILFQEAFPERYFEMGIAEQNMLSMAAGLAASDKIAYASTFAVFASGRAFDQIRQTIAIGKLKVRICGSSSGLSDFGDGSTHQSIEDIAIMSAIPNMTVLAPCDAAETRQMMLATADHPGPVYFRVVRNDVPDYLPADEPFELGRFRTLKAGADVLILAHGAAVECAMTAAEQLEQDGISACVRNASTLKPFPYAGVAGQAKACRAVITVEDHNYIGGLASQTALALRASAVPMDFVAIEDVFGQSAQSSAELYRFYGLTPEHVAEKAKRLLGR